MTTSSASVKKSAPSASGFLPSQHSQSSEVEAKTECETSGVLLEAFNLTVHLPDGSTTVTSVDSSKPMMDVLIKICAQLKLNPADYTLQVFPPDNNSWPINYKANQTFASVGMNNIVKLISKRTEKVDEKQNSQRPFEITQRIIVSLPNNQRFVMRVRPDISMSELFKAAVAHKDLDPCRYSLRHPTNPEIVLDMDYPLDFYGFSEIYLAHVNVNRTNGSPNSNSQHRNSESSKNERPTAPLSGTMSRQYEAAPRTRTSVANGHTMQRTKSDAMSKSSEFLPGTNHEKKKGLFSFFRRKKNGKSSLGGSMQNLHQIDGTSTLSLPKQDQDYPVISERQLYRQSLPSSNVKTNLTRGVSTEAIATRQLSIAPDAVASAPKKRPAPQPPAYLLPLQTETGSGRLVRPAPRLPGGPRTLSSQGEVQVSSSSALGSSEAVSKPPERDKSTADERDKSTADERDKSTADEAVKHANEGKHSPASSQSSGFGEMSPSPSEDYKKPDLNAPRSVATTTADSVPPVPQPAPRTKRKAPPPPASLQPLVMVSASALISQSATGPMVSNSSANNGNLADVSHPRNLNEENSHLAKVVEEADDENGISETNTDVYSVENTKNGIESTEFCAESLPSSETGAVEILNRIKTHQPITAENEPIELKVVNENDDDDNEDEDEDDGGDDDEDVAAEEEDYFCEMDAGYDGEIVFDNVDIVFIAPETLQPHNLSTKSKEDVVPECAITDGQSVSVDTRSQQGIQFISPSSASENLSTDVNETYARHPNEDLTHSADASQHFSVGLDLDKSKLPQKTNDIRLSREPQTVIIDRSELLSAGSLASVPELNDDYRKTLLEQDHVRGKDLNSWKTYSAEDPFDPEIPSTISDETRKKLSDDSFLVDRSLCRRFYPAESSGVAGELITSLTSERADGSSIINYATNVGEDQNFIEKTSQLPGNSAIRSLRDLRSRPEETKKSLYQLVKDSNSSQSVSNETDANDVSDVCKNDGQAERKKIKSPEPQSPVESFAVELQRHLSQWQRQHSRNSDELPTKSDVTSHNTLNNDGSSILSQDGTKLDLKRDSSTLPNTNNRFGFGSTNITNGSSSVSSTTESDRKVSASLSTGAKQFSKSDVVFTMDQLLAARSGLKKTATSEKFSELQNECSVQKPTAPLSDGNSSKSVNHVNSFSEIPPSASTASKSPPPSFQNIVASEPAIPHPLPRSTANQREKRSGQGTQNVAGKTFSRPSEPVVDLHDQLLNAIRNAGGRPVKNRSADQ